MGDPHPRKLIPPELFARAAKGAARTLGGRDLTARVLDSQCGHEAAQHDESARDSDAQAEGGHRSVREPARDSVAAPVLIDGLCGVTLQSL